MGVYVCVGRGVGGVAGVPNGVVGVARGVGRGVGVVVSVEVRGVGVVGRGVVVYVVVGLVVVVCNCVVRGGGGVVHRTLRPFKNRGPNTNRLTLNPRQETINLEYIINDGFGEM